MRRIPRHISGLLLICGLLAGCNLIAPAPSDANTGPQVMALPTQNPHWQPVDDLMRDICFEAALDAAGRVFVFEDAGALANFYAQAENSQLCRQPIPPQPFDFAGGRVIVGWWSLGRGCAARHDVESYQRSHDPPRIMLRVVFVAEGGCAYDLVQPFWVVFEDAVAYEIEVALLP